MEDHLCDQGHSSSPTPTDPDVRTVGSYPLWSVLCRCRCFASVKKDKRVEETDSPRGQTTEDIRSGGEDDEPVRRKRGRYLLLQFQVSPHPSLRPSVRGRGGLYWSLSGHGPESECSFTRRGTWHLETREDRVTSCPSILPVTVGPEFDRKDLLARRGPVPIRVTH